jgi:carboxymethylenebutenolidase
MSENLPLVVDEKSLRTAYAHAPGPVGVVIVHEFWGLNAQISSVAARYAAAGVPALAIDLYGGRVAQSREEAAGLMGRLDYGHAMRVISAGAAALRAKGVSKVASLGFCMGGAVALASAERADGLDAAVVFYGLAPELDASRIHVPLLLHFARQDEWCTPTKVASLERNLTEAGVPLTLHRYDARHAFCNETRHEVYEPGLAKLAFDRTVAFLKGLT